MKFLRRLCKNGNSMMISVPPQIIDTLRFRPGDPLIIEVLDLERMIVRRAMTIDDLRASAQPMTLDDSAPGVA